MTGHPREPGLWRGSSHTAPAEGPSSAGGTPGSRGRLAPALPPPGGDGSPPGTEGRAASYHLGPRGPARPGLVPICQQVLSDVRRPPSCPLRGWIPRSSRDTDPAPSGFMGFMGVERPPGSESWVRRRKGESWRPSFILQALEHGQVLSVVLGDRVDASPALQRLLLEPERSHHPRHTRVNVDDCQVQLIYRK